MIDARAMKAAIIRTVIAPSPARWRSRIRSAVRRYPHDYRAGERLARSLTTRAGIGSHTHAAPSRKCH
jgi:hypothetical protein